MPVISLNLPLPVLNGAGAAVDVSAIGGPLTFTAIGSFPGAIIAIEISNDGAATFSPLTVFQDSSQGDRVMAVAAQWVRANVSGRKAAVPFVADVDVAGPSGGGTFAVLPMPAGNGAGAAVDTSAFDRLCTWVCTGAFAGASVAVQISEDNFEWTTITQFAGKGGVTSLVVSASWMRVFVAGRKTTVPFSAAVAAGAVELGGNPGIGGIVVEDEGVSLGTFTTLDFTGLLVTATDAGGGVAQIDIPGLIVGNEGVPLIARYDIFNFVGAGVVATDAGPGVVDITIPGIAADTKQVFRYVVTGLEGNPFPVALPAVRASANYNVLCQLGVGGAAFKSYNPLVATFANNTFNVECGAVPDVDDVLMFTVEDLT